LAEFLDAVVGYFFFLGFGTVYTSVFLICTSFFLICISFGLGIAEETVLVEMLIWRIKIGILLVLHKLNI
jgi:hypothetical protein